MRKRERAFICYFHSPHGLNHHSWYRPMELEAWTAIPGSHQVTSIPGSHLVAGPKHLNHLLLSSQVYEHETARDAECRAARPPTSAPTRDTNLAAGSLPPCTQNPPSTSTSSFFSLNICKSVSICYLPRTKIFMYL